MMSVCAEGNTRSVVAREFDQRNVQVLPVWIAVNLQRFIEPGGFCEYAWPICLQPDPKVVNTTARVTEDVNVRIAQCCQIALGLIFCFP